MSDADPALLHRFARSLMFRGEQATKEGDFVLAAHHFERAAWGYETLGDPFPAAEATIELGRCLLFSRRGEWLPKLAGRLANLAKEEAASLPPGGLVTLLVWAAILRQGEAEPLALVQLIRARRRLRRAVTPQPPHPVLGGLPMIDSMPPLFLIPPERLSRHPQDDDWSLSPEGNWFVRVIMDPSAESRIETGAKIINLGGLMECPARMEIEKQRVIVKIAADHRGYALITALRDTAQAIDGMAS